MKLVVLDGYTENPGDLSWDALRQFGDLTVYDRTPESEVIERIAGADIVIGNKTRISAEAIASDAALKYITILATGYDIVDVAAARERGRVLHPAAQKGWGAPPVFVRRRAKKTLQTGADAL